MSEVKIKGLMPTRISEAHYRTLIYRAKEKGLPHSLTFDEYIKTNEIFEGSCPLTGDTDYIQWDHVIPLKSGRGGTVYGNLVPIRADINHSKGNRNIFEWYEENKNIFNIKADKFDSLINWLAESNRMTPEQYKSHVYEIYKKLDS